MRESYSLTEAYVDYYKQKDKRNRSVLVSRAAFWLLERVVSDKSGSVLLGALVDSGWARGSRNLRFPKPEATIQLANESWARLGVVHELASFERFLRRSVVDAIEFSDELRNLKLFEHMHDDFAQTKNRCSHCQDAAWKFVQSHSFTTRAESLAEDLGLDLGPVKALAPLLNYFWLSRNRIVHEDAYCGQRLAELSGSRELTDSLAHWNKNFSKKAAPQLPNFLEKERIVFDHAHVILCGALCYRIATTFTNALAQRMGDRAITFMSLYYAYFAENHPHQAVNHKQPEQAVGNFLSYRYHFTGGKKGTLVSRLRSYGLWELAIHGFRNKYLLVKKKT